MHGSLAAARRRSLPLTIAAARRTLARLARRSLPLAAARCALTTAARSLRAAAQSLRARCCRSLAAARRPLARRSLPLAVPSPLPLARCGARSVHAWAERKPTLTAASLRAVVSRLGLIGGWEGGACVSLIVQARSGWRSRGCVCSCALRAHVGWAWGCRIAAVTAVWFCAVAPWRRLGGG